MNAWRAAYQVIWTHAMCLHVQGRHGNLAYVFLFEFFALLQTCFQPETVKSYAWWDVLRRMDFTQAWKDENEQTRNEISRVLFHRFLYTSSFD